MNKVDLLHSVLVLGYSAFWVDTDIVHFGNALPYLHSLDVDLAIGSEYCHSWKNYTKGWPERFDHNTGTFFLRAGKETVAFVLDWLSQQRQHLLEWGPEQFDKNDMFQRRSDQVHPAAHGNALPTPTDLRTAFACNRPGLSGR